MRPIEDIKVGDQVWALDLETDTVVASKVLQCLPSESDDILQVTIGDKVFDVTEEHPFYVDGAWIPIGKAPSGGLCRLIDGSTARIESIVRRTDIKKKSRVYNLTVDATNNYFVAGVLLHNKQPPNPPNPPPCCPGPPGPPGADGVDGDIIDCQP
jgi:hypothetical protein